MDDPSYKRKARPACHQNALTLTQSSAANSKTDRAITQFLKEKETAWHAIATAHQQRALILAALQSIDKKLAAPLDIAMRKGGGRP